MTDKGKESQVLVAPRRGFSRAEFEGRTTRAQQLMREARLDAMLLTTEANFRYFTGFQSQFWESPTRPWFVVVPLAGKPIAVIPEIGAVGLASTWVEDIRTWPSPRPATRRPAMRWSWCSSVEEPTASA